MKMYTWIDNNGSMTANGSATYGYGENYFNGTNPLGSGITCNVIYVVFDTDADPNNAY